MSVDALMAEIGKLEIDEQFEITRRIQDAWAGTGLTAEQEAELDRRIAAWEANPSQSYSLEEVVAHARGKR